MATADPAEPEPSGFDITVVATPKAGSGARQRAAGRDAGAPRMPSVATTVVAVGALVALVAVIAVLGARSGDPAAAPQPGARSTEAPLPVPPAGIGGAGGEQVSAPTAVATAAPDLAADVRGPGPATEVAQVFVEWPPPPKDHDPTVTGRPGLLPLGITRGHTIVYVSDIGRATVVDLDSGDRSEVAIASTRVEDSFLVEHGRVVTLNPGRSTLPVGSDRAIEVVIHRPGRDPAASAPAGQEPGPELCLGEAGCPELQWTTGTFGTADDRIESVAPLTSDEAAVATVARLLGAATWRAAPRWTEFDIAGLDEPFRIPTPLTGTVVWLVTQTPEAEVG